MAQPTSRTYGGMDAADRKNRRRVALLDAGLELMSSVGTDKTTMTAICASAGLTERYFYESFRTKNDLVVAVLDRVTAEVTTAALEAMTTTEGTTAERARAALDKVVTLMLSDPRKGRIAFVESLASAALRAQRQVAMNACADFVVEQSRVLWGDRALSPPQDRLAAVMFVGACSELVYSSLEGHLDASVDQIVDAATSLFVTTTALPDHHDRSG
ncbi:MAG: TetR/AcrR family transcriptional regulator [Rhodococcus sp. (in: high G+C Gram-positive bacteria)]